MRKLTDIVTAFLTSDGKEVNNPKPTINYTPINKPPTLEEQIQRLMRNELSTVAHDRGMETYEESQDFDVDEDPQEPEPYPVMENEYINDQHPTQEDQAEKGQDVKASQTEGLSGSETSEKPPSDDPKTDSNPDPEN